MRTAPYGSWPSPISPEMLVRGSAGLDHTTGLVVGRAIYWTRSDPDDGGRVALLRASLDANPPAPIEATPHRYIRTAVNEYGGGAWTVAADADGGEIVVYSDWPSNDLRVCGGGVPDRLLAPGGPFRYGALTADADRRVALAVREDHRGGGEPVTTVVALDLDGHNPDGGRVIAAGADFYASPVLGPDGRVAFVQWNHPDMPWDATALMVVPLDGSADPILVSSGTRESAVYPAWTPQRTLVYLSDLSGYWNFRLWDGERSVALHEHPYDFCGPMWNLDPAPYTLVAASPGTAQHLDVGCSWLDGGFATVGLLRCDLANPTSAATLTPLPTPAVDATISGHGARSAALLGFADRPAQLVVVDWPSETITTVASNAVDDEGDGLDGYVSVAQAFEFEGDFGPVHAWYYPPVNRDYSAPARELPPVQVWSHGGPTANSGPAFKLATQFWTTRGIGIVDVNYSGSTGFGRAYRERLKGRWGVADVADCAGAALALADAGLADRARLSIRGGSAGGYTTLAALVFTDVFAAGISLYGIGDLESLATDTHKFESRYLDGLVAPYPAGRDVYLARSPSSHLEGLNCPMLILQGLDDHVVPPGQAYAMADAVRAKGLPVRLITFEGEGHGFRRAESIIETARAALAFLGEVHGF